MATDMDRPYCEWSREQLADGDDIQGESVSGILDQGSISFGRFAAESLSWEKWSVFSHNRCQEELEKFKAPGLVAQKKAYFEEYYKKVRALKRLQEAQQDVDRPDSRDVGSDPTQTNFYPNGEVDHYQHVEPRNSENVDGSTACLPEESEGFSNEITSQTDQCIFNSEAVDHFATEDPKDDSLDPDFPKSDINDPSNCVKEALMGNEQKSGAYLDDVVKNQNGSCLTIAESALVNQEEIARPKSPPTSRKSITTTQGTKRFSKIELNIKRYKEQTSHLKTKASLSSRSTRNLESFHKVPAIRSTSSRMLGDRSKPPSQGLKEPTKSTRATHSANPGTSLASRVSKSASSDRLPTVTHHPSLLAERKRAVTPKIESNLSMNPSYKSSRSGTRMPIHARETSHILNTSKTLRASGNAQKAAADRKRIPGHQATKPGVVDRHHSESRRTAANCRSEMISNIEGNKPNVQRRTEFRLGSDPKEAKERYEKEKKAKLAASGSTKFTARPLPSFYKNIPSNPEKQKMPPSGSTNLLPGNAITRPPSRHWR
ncbi:hypothetical protein EJ110_NYTH35115 [Nymphaea thermarum]|nr:hypothetical protein EJ110_NYTH35115 [Nymphaea thermarum]